MSIKYLLVKCPECGAALDIEEGRNQAFCTYCGAKILIQNDNEFIYRHIDEAEMKQADTDRMLRMRELDLEEKKRASSDMRFRTVARLLSLCVVIFGAVYFYPIISQWLGSRDTLQSESNTKNDSLVENTDAKNNKKNETTSSTKQTEKNSSTVTDTHTETESVKQTETNVNTSKNIKEFPSEYTEVNYSISDRYSSSMFSTKYLSGQYLVGTDIPAGTYVGFTTGGTADCIVYSGVDKKSMLNRGGYWSDYLVIFTVNDGEFVDVSQAFFVPIEEIEKKGLENFGIFEVGKTIPAGRYKLQAKGDDKGYCNVLSKFDSKSRNADIGFVNRFYVAVNEGDILIVGNAEFTMPRNNEADDTEDYLISDAKWGEHYGAGCYRVGIDIDPGKYVIYSNYDNGVSTTVDIYNDGFLDKKTEALFVGEGQIYDLQEGQYINYDDSATIIPFEKAYALGPEKSHIYLVGKDIEAGAVKLVHKNQDDNEYAVVITERNLNNNRYEGFDIFETQGYFEFHEGEYILLFDCEVG